MYMYSSSSTWICVLNANFLCIDATEKSVYVILLIDIVSPNISRIDTSCNKYDLN